MREGDERSSSSDSYYPPWERRGVDLSRVLSLSDGIFAFALTLLVLSLALPVTTLTNGQPSLPSQLLNDRFLHAVEAYGLVFVILSSYWRGHQLMYIYIREWDRTLVQLNFMFLGLVVLQPFLVNVISEYAATFDAVVLYAAISALTGLTLYAAWAYAAHRRRLVSRHLDDEGIRWLTTALLTTPLIFAASIAIALVSPSAAEISWTGVFVIQVLIARRVRVPRKPRQNTLK